MPLRQKKLRIVEQNYRGAHAQPGSAQRAARQSTAFHCGQLRIRDQQVGAAIFQRCQGADSIPGHGQKADIRFGQNVRQLPAQRFGGCRSDGGFNHSGQRSHLPRTLRQSAS